MFIDGAVHYVHYPYLTHDERFSPLVLGFIGSVDRERSHKARSLSEERHVEVTPVTP